MQTAAAYIRVSTEDQIEYSPDSQLKRIKEYARSHDILLLEEHIYIDEGISGRNTKKREKFNLMIATAKSKPKPFDVILVWKFSRFARNREDSIVYKSMLKKQCGIQVISISEALGDDKTSILIEALIEAMDEYYSINLAEEVKRGMTEKVSRGEPVCPAPFGYKNVEKSYVPDENAPIVRQIFNDYVCGVGVRTIAQKLNDLGVRTKRGNLIDNRFVQYVLNNPVYTGKIRWCTNGRAASKRDFDNKDNIISNGHHEAIVDEELYQKAQALLAESKRTHTPYKRRDQEVSFMLKGLLRCSNCGATLVLSSAKSPSVQCHNYNRGSCKLSHHVSLDKANKLVISALEYAQLSGNFELEIKKPKADDNKVDYEKILENEKIKLQRIKLAFQEGIDTLEEYKKNKAEITERIELLNKELLKERKIVKVDKNAYRNKISNVLSIVQSDSATEQEKNEALNTILSKIVYDKTASTFRLYFFA